MSDIKENRRPCHTTAVVCHKRIHRCARRTVGIADGGWRGFLLTHEHGDHAKYAGEVGAQIGWRAVRLGHQEYSVCGDVKVYAAECPHGQATSTAYLIHDGSAAAMLATDVNDLEVVACEFMTEASLVAIEANWDSEMLEACETYDQKLKDRIRGSHLSNERTAEILFGCSARTVIAVHLSKPCNSPERVRQALEPTVRMFGGTLIVAGDEPICVEV